MLTENSVQYCFCSFQSIILKSPLRILVNNHASYVKCIYTCSCFWRGHSVNDNNSKIIMASGLYITGWIIILFIKMGQDQLQAPYLKYFMNIWNQTLLINKWTVAPRCVLNHNNTRVLFEEPGLLTDKAITGHCHSARISDRYVLCKRSVVKMSQGATESHSSACCIANFHVDEHTVAVHPRIITLFIPIALLAHCSNTFSGILV